MMYVFGAALLLLAAAVVLLFAMMGELATREPGLNPSRITPLASYNRGARPGIWPAGLRALEGEVSPVLLVLSPICTTCGRIADELEEYNAGAPLGIAVSCADYASGEQFISTRSLERYPYLIDVGGAWVSNTFGVKISPTALMLADGQLARAYSFTSIDAVLNEAARSPEGVS